MATSVIDEPARESLLGVDPTRWLLESDEPAARWVTLARVLGRDQTDPDVAEAHRLVLADEGTRDLLGRIGDWEEAVPLSGHESPAFSPNMLGLLADMGVRAEDDERISRTLDKMLAHSDEEGRFQALAEWKRIPVPAWSALPCDSHAIVETLLRFGRGDDPRVHAAVERMMSDVSGTSQGRAFLCRPDHVLKFRGPGRKSDFCPQVTLEALRALSHLPPEDRPAEELDLARVSLRAWRERGTEKPYMFGHGRQFKRAKWPVTWYGAFALLDAVGRYPGLWRGDGALEEDARSIAEVAACLVAYNVDTHTGTVTPRSCSRGFEAFSFGQKKRPSPFATARLLAVLARVAELSDAIAEVDVTALASSKGGSGVAVPP